MALGLRPLSSAPLASLPSVVATGSGVGSSGSLSTHAGFVITLSTGRSHTGHTFGAYTYRKVAVNDNQDLEDIIKLFAKVESP